MEPWSLLSPRLLTAAHLASPVLEIDWNTSNSVGAVVESSKQWLAERRTGPERPITLRGSLILTDAANPPKFVLLDLFLRDEEWLAEWADDPIAFFVREATTETIIDGKTNCVEALQKLVGLNQNSSPLDVPESLVVLDRKAPVGVVWEESYTEATPFRVALLSMLLEIESAVLRLCSSNPHEALASLDAKDRNRAEGSANRKRHRGGSPTSMDILAATMFLDKIRIAVRLKWCWSSDPQSAETKGSLLNSVRNHCAHSGGDDAIDIQRIADCVRVGRDVLVELESRM